MKAVAKETALAVCGGCLYVVLELAWRGYSHWTMFILGGLCFVLIGAINEVIPWEMQSYIICRLELFPKIIWSAGTSIISLKMARISGRPFHTP